MEHSILTGTKQILGLEADYTRFDHDIITFINGAFFDLQQLGVGPPEGFSIEDDTAVWDDFLVPSVDQQAVRNVVFLKVRLLFDPPGTSFHLEALKKEIEKFEWRLNVNRENVLYEQEMIP